MWDHPRAGHGQLSLRFLADSSSGSKPDLGAFPTEFFRGASQIEADPRSEDWRDLTEMLRIEASGQRPLHQGPETPQLALLTIRVHNQQSDLAVRKIGSVLK